MNQNFRSLILAGVAFILISAVPDGARADETGDASDKIVIRINAAEFLGRYNYEIAISLNCDVLLKEINPRCPDLRGELSFNMANIHTTNDDRTGALVIKTLDGTKTIRQRLYYRGSVRDRRFCAAPEGSSLKYEDEMFKQRALFYSDDGPFLTELKDSFNGLSAACQEELGG